MAKKERQISLDFRRRVQRFHSQIFVAGTRYEEPLFSLKHFAVALHNYPLLAAVYLTYQLIGAMFRKAKLM